MSIKTITKHFTLILAAFLTLNLSNVALAGLNPTAPNEPVVNTGTEEPFYHIQTFQMNTLNIQFRYINGTLSGIRFLNNGDKTIQVKVFDNTYILASNDYIVINPPKVKTLIIYEGLYNLADDNFSNLFPYRFMNEHIFILPLTQDNMVAN